MTSLLSVSVHSCAQTDSNGHVRHIQELFQDPQWWEIPSHYFIRLLSMLQKNPLSANKEKTHTLILQFSAIYFNTQNYWSYSKCHPFTKEWSGLRTYDNYGHHIRYHRRECKNNSYSKWVIYLKKKKRQHKQPTHSLKLYRSIPLNQVKKKKVYSQ